MSTLDHSYLLKKYIRLVTIKTGANFILDADACAGLAFTKEEIGELTLLAFPDPISSTTRFDDPQKQPECVIIEGKYALNPVHVVSIYERYGGGAEITLVSGAPVITSDFHLAVKVIFGSAKHLESKFSDAIQQSQNPLTQGFNRSE